METKYAVHFAHKDNINTFFGTIKGSTFIFVHSQYMKFRHVVFKLSSGGARQILRLISTGGTQSR